MVSSEHLLKVKMMIEVFIFIFLINQFICYWLLKMIDDV